MMEQRTDPLIVNVCLTGMVARTSHNSALPVTPEQIAADCVRCMSLGASVFHIHARDENEEPAWETRRYSEILTRVRERCPEPVLCVTTSGRREQDVDRRAASLDATPAPDLASLTLGSLNFLREASRNPPDVIAELARRMAARGIAPELEIFDVGMARWLRRIADDNLVQGPYYCNVILGNAATAGCTPGDLSAVVSHLPSWSVVSVGGIGRAQFPANTLGILFADGVRVGLEDNLYLNHERRGQATNASLVARVVRLAAQLGRRPATADEARLRLHLLRRAPR